jgi:hypothetical protein
MFIFKNLNYRFNYTVTTDFIINFQYCRPTVMVMHCELKMIIEISGHSLL